MKVQPLTSDTQAVLLLCARLGRSPNGTDPLTGSEYNLLALWLQKRGMRPADLLHEDGERRLEEDDPPVPVSRLKALLGRGTALALAVEGWSGRGLWVLTRSDEQFPSRLRGRRAPPILYGAGDAALLSGGGLAIVGSRDAEAEALDFVRAVAKTCAEQRMQVVSGGARGVDSEAMTAALKAGGSAVGVLVGDLARAAVAGKNRDAIREDRLVLISPYDPASGFNVGHAMQRNRHIYALADYGLVASSSPGEGGTWSGATEALGQGEPVFVRTRGGRIPEGNRKLARIGALPFPEEPWTDLDEKLRHARETESVLQEKLIQDYSVAEPPNGTAYDAVLPVMLRHLETPLESKALAERLDVGPGQAQTWLKKAVEEQKVERLKNPVRYVTAGSA